MAEQASTNISLNAMASLVSESSKTVQTVVQSSNINKWAFFRPRPISINATTKLVEIDAKTTDLKLGDFRRYDHTAAVATSAADFTHPYSGSSTSLSVPVWPYALNIKELFPSTLTSTYLRWNLYTSAANRTAGTPIYASFSQALDPTWVEAQTSIPTGHSNQETQKFKSSPLLPTASVSTTSLTKPNDILYADTFIANSGGTALMRFNDGYTTITMHELQAAYIDGTGATTNSPPTGSAPGGADWTVVFPVLTTSSSSYLDTDFSPSGTTAGSWYFYLAGRSGSTWYRLGNASVHLELKIRNGGVLQSTTTLINGTLNNAGASSNEASGNPTLGDTHTWALDDVGELEVNGSVTWTGFDYYALPGEP